MSDSGLTVRQHQREDLALRIEFVVADKHREQVRFSPMSSAPQAHVTQGTAQDISSGGMGLVCAQLVPRMCEGTVRVFDPKPAGTAPDGTPVHEVAFEHRVKVRRVTLHSHEPEYAVGVAFVDPTPDIAERVSKLIESAGFGTGEPRQGDADG